MNIFSKARVRTAVDSSTKMNFNSSHITTSDFWQLTIPYYRHIVPGQSIKVDFNCFSRLAPLPVPTLGKCNFKHHAFFVPFKSVMPSWEDFITDTPHVPYTTVQSPSPGAQIVPFAHRISLQALSQALYRPAFVEEVTVSQDTPENAWDLTVASGSTPELHYYKFTARGRQVYKLLRQLGYDITPDVTAGAFSSPTYVSALPLLCVLRAYVDWFYPSAYVGDATYNLLLQSCKRDYPNGVTFEDLNEISSWYLYLSEICYDSDYFVSAFDNPAGPNNGLFSSFTIPDVSVVDRSSGGVYPSTGQVTDQNNSGTPVGIPTVTTNPTGNQLSSISQYLLDSLHALSDYMKRHQLVGSRALERYLARFGVKLDQSDRSILLGSSIQPVELGAIMSNAATESAELGSYAGQGYSNDGASFSFKSEKDYGLFFIVTTIVPEIGYVQGFDRNNMHLTKLDFFTPEFDALGTQAIAVSELKSNGLTRMRDQSFVGDNTWAKSSMNTVFGFTPRYAEYKIQLDKLTGDFNLPRLSEAGMTSDAWYLYRMFKSGAADNPNNYKHSRRFVTADNNYDLSEGHQFDRIFGNTTASADHFALRYMFRITSQMPAKALFDTYDFDEERGRQLDIESGGVKVN